MDLGEVLDTGANVMTFGGYGLAKNALDGFDLGNALGTKNNFRAQLDPQTLAQQQQFINALQTQSLGLGPDPASAMLANATNQNLSNSMGIAAAQRGINPALAARQAQDAFAKTQAQAAGQGAVLKAQQQLAAQQTLGNTLANAQAQNLQAQGINAGVAQGNANANAQMIGGLISGGSSALTSTPTPKYNGGTVGYANGGTASSTLSDYFLNPMTAAHGNTVPGTPIVSGDNPVNDTVPAVLSPGEIVIPNSILQGKNPGEEAKRFVEAELMKHGKKKDSVGYAEGGEVDFVGPDILEQTQNKLATDIPNAEPSYQQYYDLLSQDPVAAEMAVKAGTVQAPPPLASTLASRFVGAVKDVREKNIAEQMARAGIKPQPVATESVDQDMAPEPSIPPQQQVPGATVAMPNTGYDKMISGINQEAAALGQVGQQQADILQKQNEKLQAIQQDYEARRKVFDDEIAGYQKEIQEGKVDPNRYMNSLSTGGKIATAVGLILGGLGGGISGRGGNAALDTLNRIIDRDIDAQKIDMDKKKNLMGFSMQKLGNLKDAEAYSRAILISQTSNELQAAAAKSQDPLAKARAVQAVGQLEAQKAQLLNQVAARQAIAQGQKVDKEALSEDQRQRYVDADGFRGLTNTKEEAVKFRESIPAYKDTVGSLDRLIALTSDKDKTVSPSKIAEIQQLRHLLAGTMREDVLGPGTVNAEERKILLDEVLADPSRFNTLDSTTKTKLINLKNKIESKKSEQAKSIGLTAMQSSSAPQNAKMNPTDKRIYDIAMKNPKAKNAQKALSMLKDKYGI
jgi:hypothetical protein